MKNFFTLLVVLD